MEQINDFDQLEPLYLEWEAARVLPNPGNCYTKWGRFLFHLFRIGAINHYQMDAYRLY